MKARPSEAALARQIARWPERIAYATHLSTHPKISSKSLQNYRSCLSRKVLAATRVQNPSAFAVSKLMSFSTKLPGITETQNKVRVPQVSAGQTVYNGTKRLVPSKRRQHHQRSVTRAISAMNQLTLPNTSCTLIRGQYAPDRETVGSRASDSEKPIPRKIWRAGANQTRRSVNI